ncbi:hypothetical protein QVD17_06540 [Tagetes erecta]|uniref:Protein kinase domain-containing protein n=1 Tax=Tagetes erecta TaxID=13708 RepID=A0AAD8LH40_TARER|nr:hypothetical protein QVD17_06540 [Tagetes erecta]
MANNSDWIRCQSIGHGAFANVNLAKPTNQSSHFPPLMAIKSSPMDQPTSTSLLMNEFKILNELQNCPEIVTCYGDCFTVENGEKLYNVVLEYAAGGSLADKVNSSENSKLPENEVRRYIKSVLKGLQFIHRKGFVHCDIKLQNVLVFSGDNVKIADFGLAKTAAPAEEDCTFKCEIRGTPMYMAPETVTGGEQGPESDIWAVGCLVSEMITGKPVWNCSDIGSLLMKIGLSDDVPDVPEKLSDAGKDFIRQCFVKEKSKRWTADRLLNHPFIVGNEEILTSSPRNPFDFPEWESEELMVTPVLSVGSECWVEVETVSPMSRLRQLLTEGANWSSTSSWVIVR